MAALAANLQVERKDGIIHSHKVAVDIIYEGAMVAVNAAGFLAPAVAESGAVFAGVAVEKVDNSAGSAGDKECRVYKEGIFKLVGASFAQTDVGQAVYATDDQTVTKTNASNAQKVGVIVEYISSTLAWVKIEPHDHGLYAAIADATDAASAITQLNLALAVMRKEKLISE